MNGEMEEQIRTFMACIAHSIQNHAVFNKDLYPLVFLIFSFFCCIFCQTNPKTTNKNKR